MFPDSQETDLLQNKLLLIRRYCVRQLLLLWLQTIKKESFKLSCGNCILISRWRPTIISNRVFVAWLAAFMIGNVTFL